MNEERAREILGQTIRQDNGLFDGSQYTEWSVGDKDVVLDGRFNIEELEAIVWWIRNAQRTKAPL